MRNIHRGQGLTFLLYMHEYDEKTLLLQKFDILLEYQGRFFTGHFFKYDKESDYLKFPNTFNEQRYDHFGFVNDSEDVDYKKISEISFGKRYTIAEKEPRFNRLSSDQLYQTFSKILDEWEKEKDVEFSYPPYIYNLKEYGSDKPAIPFVDVSDLEFKIVGLLKI